MLLKGISFRKRLLIIFLPILIAFITILYIKNYIVEKAIIDELIHSKLNQLTSGINITFKALINSSIRNYLRGHLEAAKNRLENDYELYKNSSPTENGIIKDLQLLLKKNEISFFIMRAAPRAENNPVYIKRPDYHIDAVQEAELYKYARGEVSGHFEISRMINHVKSIESVYFTFIRKWDWYFFISFKKEKVKKLINLELLNNDILNLKVGKNGYTGIMDISGNLLIHPWSRNENVYDQTDIRGKHIYREMIKNKNGNLIYHWVYGDGIKKSILHYRYLPDIKLILFVSTPLSDHYEVFNRNRTISFILYILVIIAAFVIILLVSSSVAKPLNNLANTFKEITDHLDFKEVDVTGDKEIIELGHTFNVMINEIHSYSDGLEEKVQQRTLELKSANSLLQNEIEERKQAQTELHISEERYHRLANVTFEGIIIHEDGVIIDCNQSFADMIVTDMDDIIGKEIFEFVDEASREMILSKLHSGYEEIYEILVNKKDGKSFDAEICCRSMQLLDKTVYVAAIRDITERKQNEEELQRYREHLEELVDSRTKEVKITNEKLQIEVEERRNTENILRSREELLRLFVEYVPAAVAMLDKQLNFIVYSKKWIADYHLPDEKIDGKNINEIFPELNESWKKMHQRGLRGESHKNDEEKFVRLNGKIDWIKWEMIPWKNEVNEIGGIIIFSEVITEKKHLQEEREMFFKKLELNNLELEKAYEREQAAREEMEAAFEEAQSANEELQVSQSELHKMNILLEEALIKAEEANRLKSEFLAIMSHELRTPLTGMLGFSELLLNDVEMKPQQKKFAQLIYNSGRRLLDVLNDILEISVIEAGKINIEMSDFNVEKVVEDVEVLLADKLASKGLKLTKELNSINYIYSDPSRIRQILFNLIGNAIKFTDHGEISISLFYRNGNYVFSVKDTGIGIAEKDIDKIFDIFTQVEETMKRRYGGTGLGLNICKKLVEVLKGKIWVKSALNEGSEFSFSIPAGNMHQNSDKHPVNPQTEKKLTIKSNLKILFGEDDPTSSFFLANCIEEHKSWEGKGFDNGQDLLNEFVNNRDYDIILLDIQMPIMDGIQCLAEIRKIDKNIPVIAVTAFAMETDKKRFREMGFTDYISKPVKLHDLYALIERNTGGSPNHPSL